MTLTRKSRLYYTISMILICLLLLPHVAFAAPAVPSLSGVYPVSLTSAAAFYSLPVATGTTYTLQYNVANQFPSGNAISLAQGTSDITVSGLASGGTYYFCVSATDGSGSSLSNVVGPITLSSGNNWPWGWGAYPGYGNNYFGYPSGYGSTYNASVSQRDYSGYGNIEVTIGAPVFSINRVGVDRQRLTEGTHYSIATVRGSNRTLITLYENLLNSLSIGQHEFTFNFEGGSAYAYINVLSTRKTGSSTSSSSAGSSSNSVGIGSGNGTALRSVTVYNKASSKGKKLGSYARNAALEVTGFTSSGTYAVVNFGGQEGYVRADYIYAEAPDTLTGQTNGSASLYTEKSAKSKYEYAKVSKDTMLNLLARDGEYWEVEFNGDALYIRAKYIRHLAIG